MMGGPLQDQAARERVRGSGVGMPGPVEFERDVNLVVHAGAGSGKTRALVDRMVALVRSGVPPENMAAITFTVRAAGEMRDRFRHALHESASALAEAPEPAASASERERLLDAAARTGDLFIDTIHAFCSRMLSERPFEAGIPPDFRVLDDREEAELRHRFWTDHLDRALRSEAWGMATWDTLGVSPQDLEDFFGERCRHEDLDLAAGRPEPVSLYEATGALTGFLDRVIPHLPEAVMQRDGLLDVLLRLDRLRGIVDLSVPGQAVRLLEEADRLVDAEGVLRSGVMRVGTWKALGPQAAHVLLSLRGKADDPVVPGLGPLVMESVRPVLDAWREHLYARVGSFVDGAVEAYRSHRCAEGLLTYQDLLLRAADMLRTSPGTRRYFGDRYTHILVDEFQDTDPLQAEVVFLLASTDSSEGDWRRSRPRPGSLFFVGDDKQSIYRFRRADVQVFREACDLVERSGGESVRFTSNFRSDPRLCDWINRAVGPAFDAGEPHQAPWEDLLPAIPTSESPATVAVLDLERVSRHAPRAIAMDDASLAARAIRRLLDGDGLPLQPGDPWRPPRSGDRLAPSDILVLVRTATHMDAYLSALDAAGVPYVASGGKSLGKEYVVRAFLDLLQAACDPDDPVALLAVLRGPFAGVSDEELRRFRVSGGVLQVDARPQIPLGTDSHASILDGFRMIRLAREMYAGHPVGIATGLLLEHAALLAGVSMRPDGSSSAGALLRVLGIARGLESSGAGWIELIDELQRLVSGELTEESMTLEAGGPAVRVMTVHQAKGLQARVVFLAHPARTRVHPVDFHVDRSERRPRLFLPWRRHGRDVALPVGWPDAEREARLYEEAEHARLVYVAATRARDLLVVSRYPSSPVGPWGVLYDHLAETPAVDTDALRKMTSMMPRNDLHTNVLRDRANQTLENLAEMSKPSYTVVSVTGTAGEDGLEPDPFAVDTPGLGRGFGRAVHRLLQVQVERRHDPVHGTELERAARRILAEEGIPGPDAGGMVKRAVASVRTFCGSGLWNEVVAADRVVSECPVMRFEADGDVPGVTAGIVDLAFRKEGTWTIVDFKTESRDPDALWNRYATQLQAYRDHWEAATGEPVGRIAIWPAVPDAAGPVQRA